MRRFTVVERARLLRAISTQSRMQIIEVLKQGPLDVGELAEKLGISQSAVSQHLKVLKGFDLVTDERHSYFIAYSLNPGAFRQLEEMFIKMCRISFEEENKIRKYEYQLRRRRLLKLREYLRGQLTQVEDALKALEEEIG